MRTINRLLRSPETSRVSFVGRLREGYNDGVQIVQEIEVDHTV